MKLLAAFLLFYSSLSFADLNFFPERAYRDPTISTVIFADPFTGFLFRTDDRMLGNITVNIPLAAWAKDELFIQTGVLSTLRFSGPTFYAETLDLRVGLKWVHPFGDRLFFSVGVGHISGHTMDDVIETSLAPLNVGIDGFPLRLVFKADSNLRLGIHGMVNLGSEPFTRRNSGGIFVEYRPWSEYGKDGFFLATNLYYAENVNMGMSTHEQIGYTFHRANFLFGYHSGADLRLKHELYLNTKANFWYTGLNFEL